RKDMQTRMQGIALLGAFLRLTSFREQAKLTEDELFQLLDHALSKYFGKRGQKLVAANLMVARRGYGEVVEVQSSEDTGAAESAKNGWHWDSAASPAAGSPTPADFCERIVGAYAHGQESDLPADECAARSLIPV